MHVEHLEECLTHACKGFVIQLWLLQTRYLFIDHLLCTRLRTRPRIQGQQNPLCAQGSQSPGEEGQICFKKTETNPSISCQDVANPPVCCDHVL